MSMPEISERDVNGHPIVKQDKEVDRLIKEKHNLSIKYKEAKARISKIRNSRIA